MAKSNPSHRGRIVVAAIGVLGVAVLLLFSGFRKRTPNYIPPLATAQSAIQQALEAWQAGVGSGEIAGTKPRITVVDVHRKPGQVLERFEILGEAPDPSRRTFVVKLYLSNPIESVTTQYIVVGNDELWVFGRMDFEDLTYHPPHDTLAVESSDND